MPTETKPYITFVETADDPHRKQYHIPHVYLDETPAYIDEECPICKVGQLSYFETTMVIQAALHDIYIGSIPVLGCDDCEFSARFPDAEFELRRLIDEADQNYAVAHPAGGPNP